MVPFILQQAADVRTDSENLGAVCVACFSFGA